MTTANPTYKPNEGKREEFRRYLEKTGVMDALTKVLVLLYEEADKPDDALMFILNTLAKQTGNQTIDEFKSQVAELQEKIALLEEENVRLKQPKEEGQDGNDMGADETKMHDGDMADPTPTE